MVKLTEVSDGVWEDEQGREVKLNRNYLTNGAAVEIITGLAIPNSATWVPEENSYREEMYTIRSADARDLDIVTYYLPATETNEKYDGLTKEMNIVPDLYLYFVYIDQGQDIPMWKYYQEET